MNVLGVFGATDVVHPAACLLRDGRLVAFAEEERFARVKQACGLFPARAMAWCLREARLVARRCRRAGLRVGRQRELASHAAVDGALVCRQSPVHARRATAPAPLPGRPAMGSAALAGLADASAPAPVEPAGAADSRFARRRVRPRSAFRRCASTSTTSVTPPRPSTVPG